MDRGRRVTQDRAWSAGQDGRQPMTLHSEQTGLKRRVHAAVHPMEPPRTHSVLDRAPANALVAQLRDADHAVLTARKRRDDLVRVGVDAFSLHAKEKASNPPSLPPS